MHNNILVAVVQSGLLFLGDVERMSMIFINEVIKKCLFIQSKCHDLEFVAGNPMTVTRRDSKPSLGTRMLHVHSLSDQVLIRKPLQGGLLGAVSLPIKIKQVTFLLKKLSNLGKEMATHSSILAWRIPWTEEPGGLQSMGSQRVRHNLATKPPAPAVVRTPCFHCHGPGYNPCSGN